MIIVVDTETTHYKPELAHVIEIGAIGIDPEGRIHQFEELCDPGVIEDIDLVALEKALSINGISHEEVLSARPSEIVAEDFRSWLDLIEEEYSVQLAGYNSWNYDSRILHRDPWNISRGSWKFDVMKMCMDPMGKAGVLPVHPYYGTYKWPKLSEAEEYFKIERKGVSHRALSDARATMDILFMLNPGVF